MSTTPLPVGGNVGNDVPPAMMAAVELMLMLMMHRHGLRVSEATGLRRDESAAAHSSGSRSIA